jgi:uncharacterized membrane protein YeaQ/YmgE (transglycosylase-associated protein family)
MAQYHHGGSRNVTILAWIVLGLVAGWLAGTLMRGGGYGIVGDIVLGVLGAIVGGWLTGFLLGVDLMTGFNLQSLIVAVWAVVWSPSRDCSRAGPVRGLANPAVARQPSPPPGKQRVLRRVREPEPGVQVDPPSSRNRAFGLEPARVGHAPREVRARP